MPALPYLLMLGLTPSRVVQAINCHGTLPAIATAIGLSKLEIMTWPATLVSAAAFAPVWAGVRLGSRVRRWLSPEAFRRAALGILILMGGC